MNTRLKVASAVFAGVVGVFAAAQLVRPDHANLPTDPSRTIRARLGTDSGLVAVLDRSCNDCHSNATTWPWYTHVAPVSWVWAYTVSEGRKAVNFSEWGAYPPERQRQLLIASCKAATKGTMPGSYTALRPETRLSRQDIDTICAAAHEE